ncbi:MAG: membrane dipeptidase [Alphaproteobacteria bacterium]|nr:membrane dipeptidase [Alphaproteobacteria bacterium]
MASISTVIASRAAARQSRGRGTGRFAVGLGGLLRRAAPRNDGRLAAAFALAVCVLLFAGLPARADEAADLHRRILTLDTHVDIPEDYATPAHDPSVRGDMQVDLPKMREGGLDAAFFIVYVAQGPLTEEGYADAYGKAVAKFEAIHRQSALYGDQIELATSPEDVERIVAKGKLAACIGVENLYPIGTDLSKIEEFYRRGARYMSLTHAGDDQFADSANALGHLDEPSPHTHGGLTDLGRAAIAEMNRLGVMVDVSHSSEQSTLQAIAASRAPVIASHSALRALNDIPRNLSDRALKALAAKGGVAQIVAFDNYLKMPPPEKVAATKALREELGLTSAEAWRDITPETRATYMARLKQLHAKYGRASVSDLVDHIDHAVKVAGIDHVGIASDFGGGGGIEGYDDASQAPNVTRELLKRGYSEADIAKLWGGNLLRVWRAVEAAADKPEQ